MKQPMQMTREEMIQEIATIDAKGMKMERWERQRKIDLKKAYELSDPHRVARMEMQKQREVELVAYLRAELRAIEAIERGVFRQVGR